MNRAPECLRKSPIIVEADQEGNTSTRITEPYVAFMQQLAIGKYSEEMGMSTSGVLRVIRKMNRAGIQFPRGTDNPWGLTPAERKIIHAVDSGNVTYKSISEQTGLSIYSVRVHTSRLRRNRMQLNIRRENARASS